MMIKQKLTATATLFMLGVGFLSCTSDEDMVPGTGDGTIGMLFKLQNDAGTSVTARTSAQGLSFVDGFIQIKELEMELEGDFDREGLNAAGSYDDDDSDEEGSEWEYEVEFDEVKKVTFDQFDSDTDFFIQIPEGSYDEIEMEIDLIDFGNEPSIQLNGTYSNGDGEEIPLRYEYFGDEIDFEVEIEAEDSRFVVDRINNPLILFELVPSRWFSGISDSELENADLDDSGMMLINRDNNQSLYQKISDRIEADAEIEIEID
ncbi:hypothetical protein [Cyclobacterium jeungdonense]|uniref:DUF4382 domain-containing protein n=1 Tax=Cyclobacterium jeungdonense TaxID=708087 RepID=A0ABT8CAI5_9BACT|nr:hypothetical protein [Cyclobacterium jeungdonense]MDN3689372.1 hypothetical protein [Cyclobacterium jeungdonense]